MSLTEIAHDAGLTAKAVKHGIERAIESEILALGQVEAQPEDPPTLPIFPLGAFTPRSACPHHGPLRAGYPARVCMVCHEVSPSRCESR